MSGIRSINARREGVAGFPGELLFGVWAPRRVTGRGERAAERYLSVDADPTSHEYDVLLPGEAASIANPSKRDIEHWISVYAELCQFKETILGTLVAQRDKVQNSGRIEVAHDDVVLRSEYERLRRRLQYWQRVSQTSGRAL